MRALISGQAGIAVLIEGEEYTSMEVRSLDPVPCTDQDVAHLLRDANDLLELEGVSKEEAAHELDIAWRRDRSLHLALIALDGEADRENREGAARCLVDLLRDSSVTDFLRNRFYVAPLPALADLPGALKLAESSGSANFANVLRAVSADQERIRRARGAWDAVRPDLFGGPAEKERFGFAAVQSGAFRLLALDNSDEALARLLEFTRNHRIDAKWKVGSLLKRWQRLARLASSAQLAPHLLETEVGRSRGPWWAQTPGTGVGKGRSAWARIPATGSAVLRTALAVGRLVSRHKLSAAAAFCLVALGLSISLYLVPASAKDSVGLTPPGTAGIKATNSLLRTELPFTWRSVDAIRYFRKAEGALSDGEFSDAARWYEMSREAVDTPAAQLNFGVAVYNTFDLPRAASIFSAGLKAARANHNEVLEGAFLTNLGNVHREQGLLDQALQEYNDAWEIDNRDGYALGLATAEFNRGVLFGMRGAFSSALSQIEVALRTFRQTGDKAGEADTLVVEASYVRYLADVLSDSKLLFEAWADLRAAALLYDRLPGVLARANYHNAVGMGYFHYLLDNTADEAAMDRDLEAFHRAYAIYERVGYKQGQFVAMGGLGNAYKFEHNSAQASDSWMRCLIIAREMGSPFREAIALGGVGGQDEASGKHYDALENYGQAAQLASRIGAYGLEALNLESLGEVRAEMGGQEPASVYFEGSMEAAKKSGDSYLQINTAMDIARAYSRLHDAERAREALYRLRDLCSAAGYANQAAEAQRRIDELPH